LNLTSLIKLCKQRQNAVKYPSSSLEKYSYSALQFVKYEAHLTNDIINVSKCVNSVIWCCAIIGCVGHFLLSYFSCLHSKL